MPRGVSHIAKDDPAVAPLYEHGYAGGLVFRQKQQLKSVARDRLERVPRIVPPA